VRIRNPFRNKVTITPEEAARRLGVSQRTIYRWIYQGRIHGVRPANQAGIWRVEEADISKLGVKRLANIKKEVEKQV